LEFEVYLNGENLFDRLRFMTIPGYDLEKLPKEQVKLMDDVRRTVESYFSLRPKDSK